MICNRCGQEARKSRFNFHEVDEHDNKHKFGTFCHRCTLELVDELRGKVEWLRIGGGWRGYIQPKARLDLEKSGFIHAKCNAQFIKITRSR